jgi:manganese oxidase
MRNASSVALSLLLSVTVGGSTRPPRGTQVAAPNDNTRAAGTLEHGVLTLTLDARRAVWYPDGDSLPGREVEAFAEASRPPLVPGPLVRVPAGTTVSLTVRNTLERDSIVFLVPPEALSDSTKPSGDSVAIAPGESAALRFTVPTPGNYIYRARTNDPLARALKIGGLMAGALVVDSAGLPPPRDRIMVLLASTDSVVNTTPAGTRLIFSINGRSWPHTERISATVGDSVRWRVINANNDIHPMHLHGFYYRVDAFNGPAASVEADGHPGSMVVTQRLPPFTAMSLTWVPERAGNWLFHCHFQVHVARRPGTASDDSAESHEQNHALMGMQGLVMGVLVKARPGASTPMAAPAGPVRRLRLVAVQDSGFPTSAPSMRFTLQEPATGQPPASAGPGFSPPIVLERGKPVAIMVVNTLREPTAVHWHGIELDSYYDGVAGFGGSGDRVSPVIAPRDSFEARFTPPRTGTFIYHTHANEPRQHRAGLLGALIVLDSASGPPRDDYTFFLKSARAGAKAVPVLDINGQADPDTMVFHVGRPARLRFISLALLNPNAAVSLTTRGDSPPALRADSLVVPWRPIAKDGADLPAAARVSRRARQVISMGETYDFEFTPTARGTMRVEVRGGGPGGLLARVPIRVE